MKLLTTLMAALLAWPAWAQEDALKALPGYVDFGPLTELFGEPSVQIAVGQSLLGMISAISASEDPEAAALFKRLQGVRVTVFESTPPAAAAGALDHVKTIAARLSGQGWEPVVTVNAAEEQVRIFMKINDALIEGITVMAMEPGESVFINVIGSLSPAELEQVMERFDLDVGRAGGPASASE